MRRWSLFFTLLVLLLPGLALACPTCATSKESSMAFWVVLGSFVLLPVVLSATVIGVLWKHLRLANTAPTEPEPRPTRRSLKLV